MSADELLREREESDTSRSGSQTTSHRSRLASKITGMFSPRYFLVALVVLSIGLFTPSLIPIVSALPGTGLVGLFVAAFALGGFGSDRRYLEIGVGGAVAVSMSILSRYMTIAVVGSNMTEFATVGFGVGVLVAVIGYYFGRDFRDGLTRDLE